jgi:hypothetical protein
MTNEKQTKLNYSGKAEVNIKLMDTIGANVGKIEPKIEVDADLNINNEQVEIKSGLTLGDTEAAAKTTFCWRFGDNLKIELGRVELEDGIGRDTNLNGVKVSGLSAGLNWNIMSVNTNAVDYDYNAGTNFISAGINGEFNEVTYGFQHVNGVGGTKDRNIISIGGGVAGYTYALAGDASDLSNQYSLLVEAGGFGLRNRKFTDTTGGAVDQSIISYTQGDVKYSLDKRKNAAYTNAAEVDIALQETTELEVEYKFD